MEAVEKSKAAQRQEKYRRTERYAARMARDREKLKAYYADWYRNRKDAGLMKDQYAEQKSQGKCPNCGQPHSEKDCKVQRVPSKVSIKAQTSQAGHEIEVH